jgi:hypothetical protein
MDAIDARAAPPITVECTRPPAQAAEKPPFSWQERTAEESTSIIGARQGHSQGKGALFWRSFDHPDVSWKEIQGWMPRQK